MRVALAWGLLVLCHLSWGGPAASFPQHTPSVLVLSSLSPAQDQALMHALADELADLRPQAVMERIAVDSQAPAEGQRAAVRQILGRHAWSLVVTTTLGTTELVMQAAPQQPLLFRMVGNPVSNCMVDRWRQPGGSATGHAHFLPAHAAQIQVLKQAYPELRHIVVLLEGSYDTSDWGCGTAAPSGTAASPPCHPGWLSGQQARQQLQVLRIPDTPGLQVHLLTLCVANQLARLPQWLVGLPDAGLVVPYDTLSYSALPRYIQAIQRIRRPAVYGDLRAVALGGLLQVSLRRNPTAGVEQVRRILAGTPPGDIPIQRPDGFEVSLNLSAARQLDRPPSRSVLRSADHLVH